MSMGGPTFFAEDAYALSRRYPEHFTWMCNLCPDGTDLTHEKIKRYKQMGAVGLGEFGTRIRFDDPKMDHLFAVLEQVQMPFLFHMAPADADPYYGIVDDARLMDIETEWYGYIERLESMGIDQCVEIEQAAYDAYINE